MGKSNYRKSTGITLITLVVIILIILTGVGISLVIANNGRINGASELSKSNTIVANENQIALEDFSEEEDVKKMYML